MRKILPKILAVLTGKDRYLPNIEWSSSSWTHNLFRFHELIFWRQYGIRREAETVSLIHEGRQIIVRRFYTAEAILSFAESVVRDFLNGIHIEFVRVPELQFVGAKVIDKPFKMPIYTLAIAFDAHTGQQVVEPASSLTFSHTCTGSNRLLAVGVLNQAGPPGTGFRISGVTYAASAMTIVNSGGYNISGSGEWIALYYKTAPSTGANNVVVTGTQSTNFQAYTTSYTGVHQTTPVNTYDVEEDTATTLSTTLTTTVADCWAIGFFRGTTTSNGTNFVLRDSGGVQSFDSNASVGAAGSISVTSGVNSSAQRSMVVMAAAPSSTTTNQTVTATTTVTGSIATAKTILSTLTATVSGTGSVLKGMYQTLTATVTGTASMITSIAYPAVLEAITTVTASIEKAATRVQALTASAVATASLTKIPEKLLSVVATATATVETAREVLMTAAVTITATTSTAIGLVLNALVTIVAKVSAPFHRTKYPAHGDETAYDVKYTEHGDSEDYSIKYPHE